MVTNKGAPFLSLFVAIVSVNSRSGKTVNLRPRCGGANSVMSEEVATHIFEKFYRGDASHTEPGNGLGLTIAQKITELHGGVLRAENTPVGYIVFRAVFS